MSVPVPASLRTINLIKPCCTTSSDCCDSLSRTVTIPSVGLGAPRSLLRIPDPRPTRVLYGDRCCEHHDQCIDGIVSVGKVDVCFSLSARTRPTGPPTQATFGTAGVTSRSFIVRAPGTPVGKSSKEPTFALPRPPLRVLFPRFWQASATSGHELDLLVYYDWRSEEGWPKTLPQQTAAPFRR